MYGPSLLHCKSRQQPRITNRCHAKPPTRTTYGTTRPYQTLHRSHQLTNGVNTSGDTANPLTANGVGMQPSQFQGSHELHVHVPRETTHAPSQHYQALTANGLTSTCKQNPIGPVPLHTPTNDCSLQVQGDNGAIPTQQNHQSPSLLPHELTNNTCIHTASSGATSSLTDGAFRPCTGSRGAHTCRGQ